MGSVDHDFVEGIISQLMNAGTKGQEFDGKGPNFMLSVIQGVAPRDEVECMLAVQMAAVHMATMTFARRLAHVENIPEQDAAERAFNKLARTFAVQMEALKRYRTGGEQKVTVHHVTVNEGGQAIVGAVSQTSQTGGWEIGRRPHERHTGHAPVTALHRHVKADAVAVSGGRGHRMDGLPLSWGQGRRPKGDRNGVQAWASDSGGCRRTACIA